jgi:cobalt-zinc-cadmium resistance protein CzcA
LGQQKQRRTKEKQFIQQKERISKVPRSYKLYNQYGKKLSDEIIKVANLSYKHGEIDFFSTFKV